MFAHDINIILYSHGCDFSIVFLSKIARICKGININLCGQYAKFARIVSAYMSAKYNEANPRHSFCIR